MSRLFKKLSTLRFSSRDKMFVTCPNWLPCSPISPHVHGRGSAKLFFQLLSLAIKTKVVQNVNRMSEKQKDRPTDSQTDRQTDRQKTKRLFSLVIKTKVVQNVNRMSER